MFCCRMTCALLLLSASFTCGASTSLADNWAHWRGPSGNGVAEKATPPTKWSATENVRWKVAIPGRSSGSPVIWEDQVFVVTAVETSGSALSFELHCYDRSNGDLKWKRVAIEATPSEGTHHTNGYASASPCTDGEFVYAHFGSQGTYCFTTAGKPIWQRDLGDMQTRASFGEGSSPTIEGEMLLVPWDHEGPSALFALNKRTGDTLWETPRDEPTCWATPLVVEHGGKKQVVMNGQNYARSYDLESGKELWRCGGQTQRPVASAVAGDGMVFVGSGFRGSFLGAFTPDGSGDIEGTSSVVWSVSRNTPDIASPLLSGDRLYFTKAKSGLLSCHDAKTGKPHYVNSRVRLDTLYASPVAAGGNLYLTDRRGETVVVQDAEEFKVVATNSVGETVDATPAPVDNELFIRGEKHLFCIAE